MRKMASTVLGLALVAACGGGAKNISDMPQNAAPSDGAGAAPSASSAAAAPLADAGPPTTTDAIDPDAGAGQKLAAKKNSNDPLDEGTPGRTRRDVMAVIGARRDQARKCYDDGLKNHPGIEGSLVVQWTIDPKGNVTKISLDSARSAITEPSVVACVIEVIKPIKFAEHPDGKVTETNYKYDFHPHHSAK